MQTLTACPLNIDGHEVPQLSVRSLATLIERWRAQDRETLLTSCADAGLDPKQKFDALREFDDRGFSLHTAFMSLMQPRRIAETVDAAKSDVSGQMNLETSLRCARKLWGLPETPEPAEPSDGAESDPKA